MGDFWLDLGVSVVISCLRQIVKNPAKKEEMRKVFRKIHDLISVAYPEFNDE